MKLRNILEELNYINIDEKGNICFLPSFYNILNKFKNLFKKKKENKGYKEIFFDEDYIFSNNNYSYYYINNEKNNYFNFTKKFPCISFVNSSENEELMRYKVMNIISLVERFIQEEATLPTLCGKIVDKKQFNVYVLIDDSYLNVCEIKYDNKKFSGKINLTILLASIFNNLDEIGLIVPPQVSYYQICFLLDNLATSHDHKIIEEYVKVLSNRGINSFVDYSPSSMKEKISNRSKEGIPLLIEVYHKNIEKNSFTLINRLSMEKKKITNNDFMYLDSFLEDIQRKLYQKNLKDFLNNKIDNISTCMNEECIDKFKEEGFEFIVPFLQIGKEEKCQICGNYAKKIIKKVKKF